MHPPSPSFLTMSEWPEMNSFVCGMSMRWQLKQNVCWWHARQVAPSWSEAAEFSFMKSEPCGTHGPWQRAQASDLWQSEHELICPMPWVCCHVAPWVNANSGSAAAVRSTLPRWHESQARGALLVL